MQHVAELRFEPANDTARDKALFGHIAGGKDENTERPERHSANVRLHLATARCSALLSGYRIISNDGPMEGDRIKMFNR